MSRTMFLKLPRGLAGLSRIQFRSYSVSKPHLKRDLSPSLHTSTPSNPRWFAGFQDQLKQLKSEQYPPECMQRAEQLFQYSEENWLELLAGREGFLTDKTWKPLDSHQLLWGDMDSMGHINNVMYNRYIETARVQFVRHHGEDATMEEKRQWDDLPTPRSLGLILKSITTEFKFPMKFPDRITVLYKLVEPPIYDSTSLKMEAWILSEQHRRVAARCVDETTIYDYTSGQKSVLRPFMVDKLQLAFELQTACKNKYTEEANRATTAVEELKRAFQ
ncbi:thioesterase-like superfamily-domain-containing protein [Dactylonectria estremocensis]|uniref:Thioesterase-like superfamily-domain-containing protein n=1 Tax=Dactylonectria estremocensis TaxID=1079267 RepID=A0A9P9EVQ8_9HYPO|nr:thioesterase-like superfamily-domain-containing protein [Dactylonectria estremocensis]